MKKGTQGFFTERGVMVVHATGILSLASVLRNQLIQICEMKLGQLQRDNAIKLTLEYLEGPEFANSMDAIIQESVVLYNDLKEEVKKHVTIWKKRYYSYKKVHEEAFTARAFASGLSSDVLSDEKLRI